MTSPYPGRIAKCCEHMRHLGMDILRTKPSNLFYLTGDSRRCNYTGVSH